MTQRSRRDPAAPPLPGQRIDPKAELDEASWRLRGNGCWLPLYCSFVPVLAAGSAALILFGLALFIEYPT